jgi:hypothetical protein
LQDLIRKATCHCDGNKTKKTVSGKRLADSQRQ